MLLVVRTTGIRTRGTSTASGGSGRIDLMIHQIVLILIRPLLAH